MASRTTSPSGIAELAGSEGIVLSPYRDSVGVWTFGVGHTKSAGSPNPRSFPLGRKQPLSLALEVFRQDLKRFEDRVNRAVTVPIAQHQFDALVSFDFNTGGIHRARLTRLLNDGKVAEAAEAFDGWHRPPEIIPRRNNEKRLFRDGVYAHGGKATVYPADGNGRVLWSAGEQVNVLALMQPTEVPPRQPDDPGPQPRDNGSKARGALFGAAIVVLGGLAFRFRKGIGRLFVRASPPIRIAMVAVPIGAAAIIWFWVL